MSHLKMQSLVSSPPLCHMSAHPSAPLNPRPRYHLGSLLLFARLNLIATYCVYS